jgi:hypothetical protein
MLSPYPLFFGFAVALLTAAALAEVMDKEPSLPWIWGTTPAIIVGAALFGRWRPWAPLVVWPLGLVNALAIVGELLDPHVGPAIGQEAGYGYVVQAAAAAALTAIAPLATCWWAYRARMFGRRHAG